MLILLLTLGHFIVDMHAGALPALFPLLQNNYGLSYTQIAALTLISQVTSSVIQPAFGVISDRWQTRWMLPVSQVVAIGGLLFISAADTYNATILGVIVLGLGIAAYHPESSKLVYHVSDDAKGKAMSVFALGGNAGLAAGPMWMGLGLLLWGIWGTVLFIPLALVTGYLLWRALPRLYAGMDAKEQSAENRQQKADRTDTVDMTGSVDRAGSVDRDDVNDPAEGAAYRFAPMGEAKRRRTVVLLLIVIFLRSGVHGSLMTFIPLYFTNYAGHSAAYGSMLLTVFLLFGAAGTALGGAIADKIGPRPVVIGSLALSVPFIAGLPHTTSTVVPVLLLSAVGLVLISSWAVTTVIGQVLLPGRVGLASGLTLGFSVGTGGLSVTALGWLGDVWGLPTVLTVTAAIAALGALFSLWLPGTEGRAAGHPPKAVTPGTAGRSTTSA